MNPKNIKGIIFDYGATIDSNGKHWSEILWTIYKKCRVPIAKKIFFEAYVFGERYLNAYPIIKPQDTFREVLLKKINLQFSWLIEKGYLHANFLLYSSIISNQCYNLVSTTLIDVIPILEILYSQYPLVLVSNFYGNIQTVLKDFNLNVYFKTIIESAVVKIRKPDPAIFALGINALNLKAKEVVVIGDSYKKDIFPSKTLGCYTIWLKRSEQKEKIEKNADFIIHDFKELKILIKK